MNTPDLSNAPEGATHFSKFEESQYYKANQNIWFYFNYDREGWVTSGNTDAWLRENLLPIPQPAKEDWFSKGELPPVGIECEMEIFQNKWHSGKIVAHVKDINGVAAIIQCKENWFHKEDPTRFRPLKSDRDKCIEASYMLAKNKGYLSIEGAWDQTKNIFGELYDAGMLRMPEDK